MSEVAALPRVESPMTRRVLVAGGAFLFSYAFAAVLTGQRDGRLGHLAQLVPVIAYAALSLSLARLCTGQVRVFWNLNAIHAITWTAGQALATYYDLTRERVPLIALSDPIFFVSSIPLAAALYGRPERDRPRWLFDIVLLDLVLIALFAAFLYVYFIVSLSVTGGPEETYKTNLTQLVNAKNLLLAGWAAVVWYTAVSPPWKRVLGIYGMGLSMIFAWGILHDLLNHAGAYRLGSLWDLLSMAPYVVLAYAAAQAYDEGLFSPLSTDTPIARLPVVSLIAVAMLVMIPTTAEIARRVMDVPAATESVRTRLALTMMIPFGIVVVIREFLSRRALLRAGQELVHAREQLVQQEKLAAVGQLVAGVAHELNNPLQGVLGYAELMALSESGAKSEELRAIRENAARAAGIVRNLLTFAGREASSRSWQQINGIVQETAAKRAPLLQLAGISVQLDLADRLPLTYLDATPFEQLLNNLIDNAQAAIESRKEAQLPGVVSSSALDEVRITTRRQAGPDRISIDVADNGIGIRPHELTRIFDPFFSTRADGQGAGLGLSVCYGIVREHGGTIHAHNREEGGASFVVELPVLPEAHASGERGASFESTPVASLPVAVSEPAQSFTANRPKALVVDDEESNATLMRRALDIAGYEVESTTLSRRALTMIERTPYDVVVTDVKMPELDGPELYARACQIRPEMARRFIFVTGDIDGRDTRNFLEGSRCGFLMKPFNLERLTTAVDMLVGGHRDEAAG